MIQVYDGNAIDFEKNGAAVLLPTNCDITEEAAGSYELTMTHPVDPRGVWRFLQPGYIIKAPVPVATTEQIVSGDSVDVYRATTKTEIRAKPIAPSRIKYQTWYPTSDPDYGEVWQKGDKVTDPYDGNNYQCILGPLGSDADFPPSDMGGYWTHINNYSGGAAIVITIDPNTEVYLLARYDDNWLRVVTMGGIEGYVSAGAMAFDRSISVEPVQPRTVSNQLFRIYSVTVNGKSKSVSVNARHVSYDLSGNLLDSCVLVRQPPATALALIREALMRPVDFTLATNLTEEEDGSYTGTHTYQNGIYALLDPDSGFVNHYKARLFRDNWDMFVYRNTKRDRGLRLERGKNLTGVTWTRNTDKLINRVIPVAKAADGSELFLDNKYIDSPIIDSYPVIRIEKLAVDGQVGKEDGQGGIWTEETLKFYMEQQALRRFEVDNADKAQVEIKTDFVLLGDTEEYKPYKELQKLYMYDTVTVRDREIDLEQKLQVSKIVWDPIRLRYKSCTLGDVFNYASRSIAGYQLSQGTIQFDKLSAEAVAKIKEA